MPEAAVYKDYKTPARKYEIGRSRQVSTMQAKPQSHGMRDAPDLDFGHRVARAYP